MVLYLPILLGTVREGRRSLVVARRVEALLRGRGHETRVVDPAALPFGDLVRREWEMHPRPPVVRDFVDDMARADGFVVVAPEYNHGYPGALKNLLDALYDEWNRKPFALVGVGGISGGARMIEGLRGVIAGLGAISIPASVPVQHIAKAIVGGELAPEWDPRLEKLLGELVWYAEVLKPARAALAASASATG